MTKGHARVIEQSTLRLRAIYGTLGPVLATLHDLGDAEAGEVKTAVLSALQRLDNMRP